MERLLDVMFVEMRLDELHTGHVGDEQSLVPPFRVVRASTINSYPWEEYSFFDLEINDDQDTLAVIDQPERVIQLTFTESPTEDAVIRFLAKNSFTNPRITVKIHVGPRDTANQIHRLVEITQRFISYDTLVIQYDTLGHLDLRDIAVRTLKVITTSGPSTVYINPRIVEVVHIEPGKKTILDLTDTLDDWGVVLRELHTGEARVIAPDDVLSSIRYLSTTRKNWTTLRSSMSSLRGLSVVMTGVTISVPKLSHLQLLNCGDRVTITGEMTRLEIQKKNTQTPTLLKMRARPREIFSDGPLRLESYDRVDELGSITIHRCR